MALKVLILGVNGFIGSTLSDYILKHKDWEIYGMDMHTNNIQDIIEHRRFHFTKGDITVSQEWVSYHIEKCDVVLPLVAIANPAIYVQDPLRVFELDFEANLPVIRQCVKHKKRIIFPSTSEVYGMCADKEFDEETSSLVLGPVTKQRWIYSCSKQLLDRIIFAYGVKEGLDYTLFRPFNWIGPRLDHIVDPQKGTARSLTIFISGIFYEQKITLVDGGKQRRSFTDIDDGIEALAMMIENKDQCASQRIFNLGNPRNDVTIAEMAHLLVDTLKTYPEFKALAEKVKFIDVPSAEHYGASYQDTQHRVPSIENARKHLGWEPKADLAAIIKRSLDYYLSPAQRHMLPV